MDATTATSALLIPRGTVGSPAAPLAATGTSGFADTANGVFSVFGPDGFFHGAWSTFLNVLPFVEFLLWIATIGLAVLAVWLFMRVEEARHEEKHAYGIGVEPAEPEPPEPAESNGRAIWAQVLEHAESSNESDWRRAILEADIMLDDLLRDRGYEGATLAERLRGVSPSEYPGVDQAWAAHRVRNAIAHEGDRYSLNQSEARRVVNQYEAVFREFHYI